MKKFVLVVVSLLSLSPMRLLAQNERILLLESFTSTSCYYCGVYNPALDSLIADNPDKIAAIKYHASIPSANDPMYLHNTIESDAMMDYYGVTSVPRVVVNGNRFSGSPNQLNQNIINQLQALESPIELHLTHTVDHTENTITVHVSGKALSNLVGDIRLFVGIIEKEIHFGIPPGSNGEMDFHNVMKKLLPSASGQSLGESLSADDTFDFSFTWDLANVYDIEQLDAIAWVQNRITKEVFQACKSSSSHNGIEENSGAIAGIFPNPTSGRVTIIAKSGQKTSIINMAGQCVYQGTIDSPFQIDLGRFGTGIYAIKVGSETQRVIVK